VPPESGSGYRVGRLLSVVYRTSARKLGSGQWHSGRPRQAAHDLSLRRGNHITSHHAVATGRPSFVISTSFRLHCSSQNTAYSIQLPCWPRAFSVRPVEVTSLCSQPRRPQLVLRHGFPFPFAARPRTLAVACTTRHRDAST
jgi:hypothetical protein